MHIEIDNVTPALRIVERCSKGPQRKWGEIRKHHLLVMGVSDPRECAEDGDSHRKICRDAGDEDCIVRILMINEYQNDAENEPCKSGCSATTVNATKMLEDRSTSESEPEGSPLQSIN